MNINSKILDIIRDKYLFRRLSGFLIGRSRLGKLFRIKIKIQDYYIFFHPTGICSAFWRNPNAYIEDYEFIHSYLKEGDISIDIGANVGVTVIPAAKAVGERGRVIAFEAHPLICSYLEANVVLNNLKNVKIHNYALGNQRGYVNFTDEFHDEGNRVESSSIGTIKVPISSLDDYKNEFIEFNEFALLKLDVEGYEKFVIEGAGEVIEKVNCIYFEVSENNFRNFGYQTEDVLIALEARGFSLFKRKDDKKEIVPIDSKYIPLSSVYENLIAIRNIQELENRTQWRIISN